MAAASAATWRKCRRFHSLLPMYRVKFFYAEMLSVVSSVMSPVMAMRVGRRFSRCCCSAAIMLLWLRSAGALALAPVFAAAADHGRIWPDGARQHARTCCARRCSSAGSLPMCRQRKAATAILLFLAFLVRPGQYHLRCRVRRAAGRVPAMKPGACWPASPHRSPPISRSRTGPSIPAGGRISISPASSSS